MFKVLKAIVLPVIRSVVISRSRAGRKPKVVVTGHRSRHGIASSRRKGRQSFTSVRVQHATRPGPPDGLRRGLRRRGARPGPLAVGFYMENNKPISELFTMALTKMLGKPNNNGNQRRPEDEQPPPRAQARADQPPQIQAEAEQPQRAEEEEGQHEQPREEP